MSLQHHVDLLSEMIRAETAWRDNLAAQKQAGFVAIAGRSIEKLISDTEISIRGHRDMIAFLTHSRS